jgi:hypothetical protein
LGGTKAAISTASEDLTEELVAQSVRESEISMELKTKIVALIEKGWDRNRPSGGVGTTDSTTIIMLLAALGRLLWRGLRFATTTGGDESIPPVVPSVAASKQKSACIETCFKGAATDGNNA